MMLMMLIMMARLHLMMVIMLHCHTGQNGFAQLGIPQESPFLSRVPVEVVPPQSGANLTYSDISAGSEHTCALAGDGTQGIAYCWGQQTNGRLVGA